MNDIFSPQDKANIARESIEDRVTALMAIKPTVINDALLKASLWAISRIEQLAKERPNRRIIE